MKRLVFVLILTTAVFTGVAVAQTPKLVIARPGGPTWPENEVAYSWEFVSRYWSGSQYVLEPSDCPVPEECQPVAGAEVTYPSSGWEGIPSRSLFLPNLLFFLPDVFGPDSPDDQLRAQGILLADRIRADDQFFVRIGIADDWSLPGSEPDSYFPRDYFGVSAFVASMARVKSLF